MSSSDAQVRCVARSATVDEPLNDKTIITDATLRASCWSKQISRSLETVAWEPGRLMCGHALRGHPWGLPAGAGFNPSHPFLPHIGAGVAGVEPEGRCPQECPPASCPEAESVGEPLSIGPRQRENAVAVGWADRIRQPDT